MVPKTRHHNPDVMKAYGMNLDDYVLQLVL